MRFYPIVSFVLALFLTSCANQGVIVQKNSGPLPFYESLGVDGSYKLALRDQAGAVHSQLVTPEVFQGYAEGDYFNDLQPPPAQRGTSAAAKGTASIGSARGQGLAGGNSQNGNRIATNAKGAGHNPALVKAHQSSTTHSVASAPRSASPVPVTPKAESPVVSAHFTVAVQPTLPAHPAASGVKKSPAQTALAANAQTAPRVHSVALMTQQESVATANVHKPSVTKTMAARTSQPSNHVASNAPKLSTGTPLASGASQTQATPKAPTKVPTHSLTTSKQLASKKGAKLTAHQTAKAKAVDPSRSAHAAASGQVALVR